MLSLTNDAHMQVVSARKSTGNALRITAPQRTIAAVMNGVVPGPEDIEAMQNVHISEQLLHMSTAAALRQALMSRPSVGSRERTRRRAGARDVHAIRDAYYLALALAADADGDPSTLRSIIGRDRRSWLDAAALVGKMQIRFLEQVCEQIDLTANHLQVPATVAPVTAATMLASGGRITDTTLLLADYSPREAADPGWLHATSTVVIEGYSGTAVVDAGPPLLPAAWSARIAAPLTITASAGRWPVTVVRDALWLCQDAVRQWAGSMTRQLSGSNDEDLVLLVGPPLRRFLTSPASEAIARCADWAIAGTGYLAADSASVIDSVPLLAVDSASHTMNRQDRADRLKAMRYLEHDGQELAADIELADAAAIAEVHREELVLLSATVCEPLTETVEVTANITAPDWQDMSVLVQQLRPGASAQLAAPLIGRTDQEIIGGDGQRLTLRVRAHRGIPLSTREGYAVFLAAGTRYTVLGTDTEKGHVTVYLEQELLEAQPSAETPAVHHTQSRHLNVA
ncbi:hypothetical protein [Mycobacteroides abscessus]|uniref:hypothetical protein n=1 Tax=Mycobacteroides abscessus TaxID=36809 RepID=UPI001F168401|nr:hypothetical protein [Mycobacteroides abscessus]